MMNGKAAVDAAIGRLPMAGERGKHLQALVCANLRRDDVTGDLHAAPLPAVTGKLSALPVFTLRHSKAGRIALVQLRNRLRAEYLDVDMAAVNLGSITGKVTCAVQTGEMHVAVMTDAERYDVSVDGEGVCSLEGLDSYPILRFSAENVMSLSQAVEPRGLKGTYDSRSARLCDDDADRLTADLDRAYRQLEAVATGSGARMQPVLARYRLEGEGGEVLYRSGVTLVAAPSGVQCAGQLTSAFTNDNTMRGAMTLKADVYNLRLKLAAVPAANHRHVARLVVETSLPVHPFDRKASAANALGRSGANAVELRCFVPGASVTTASSRRQIMQRIKELALKGDEAFHTALTVNDPFGMPALDVTIPPSRRGLDGLDAEIDAVSTVLRAKIKPVDRLAALCRVPNRFVASAAAVCGETVAWGNVTAKGFRGYPVEAMAVDVTPAGEEHQWRAVSVVELTSGARRVAASWGTAGAPLKFAPMLSYPSADARWLTLSVERDGVSWRRRFELTPSADGCSAIYCAPDCSPVELEQSEVPFEYAGDAPVDEVGSTSVVTASAANPYDALSAAYPSSAAIVDVRGVDRRGSSWDFTRNRLYVFSGSGIYLGIIGDDSRSVRYNRIDRRGVAGKDAVAEIDDDRYPAVCIAGGCLLGLSRGSVSTLEREIGDVAVGWDADCHELWLRDVAGNARVKQHPDGGWRSVKGMSAVAFQSALTSLLIDDGTDVRDTALSDDAAVGIDYSVCVSHDAAQWYCKKRRIAGVAAEMWGEVVEGRLSLIPLPAPVSPRPVPEAVRPALSTLSFAGTVDRPLNLAVVPQILPHAVITIDGTVGRRTVIRQITALRCP